MDDQRHGERFEQQSEAGAGLRPRNLDLGDATRRAGDPRHARMKESLMLEEIQMPPRLLGGVVHRAIGGLAFGAGKARARFEVDLDVEPLVLRVEVGSRDEPRRVDVECKLEKLRIAHRRHQG